jgi:plasmid stabilization system protein ParE
MGDDPRVILRRAVPDDLSSILDYLGARSPAAADRFIDAVQSALNKLTQFPEAGSLKQFRDARLRGVRTWRVPGFKKYLIIYRPIDIGIEVLAVLHGSRNLRARLRERQ